MYRPVIMDVSPNNVVWLLQYIPKNEASSVLVFSYTGILIAALQ